MRSLFKLARGGQVYQTEKNVGQKGPQDGGSRMLYTIKHEAYTIVYVGCSHVLLTQFFILKYFKSYKFLYFYMNSLKRIVLPQCVIAKQLKKKYSKAPV